MNYYNQIKSELINNEAYKRIKDYSKNRSDLKAYYNVGKLLIEAQGGEARAKYGERLIKEYAQRLTSELSPQYGYRNLMYMRKFYLLCQNQKVNTPCSQLTWSHYRSLLSIHSADKINYYISQCEKYNLSVRDLRERIKNQDYERLPAHTREKLAKNKPVQLQDTLKDPIIIRNDTHYNAVSEKILQQLILEDLPHFLEELGEGFCFIKNEYKIRVNNRDNYIDLLLFNIIHNCYVVVELKVTELKAEHIGQVQKYMKAVDTSLKTAAQCLTVGVVITRHNNQFIKGYCSDERVFGVEWKLK